MNGIQSSIDVQNELLTCKVVGKTGIGGEIAFVGGFGVAENDFGEGRDTVSEAGHASCGLLVTVHARSAAIVGAVWVGGGGWSDGGRAREGPVGDP